MGGNSENDGTSGISGSEPSRGSQPSHNSRPSPSDSPGILLPRRDFRRLLTYQKSEVIYELTFHFCRRFLSTRDRTVDQMVQAARSGKQNIIEGSAAGVTSKEMEIKLTNVARASLEELLEDYLDFLRTRDLPVWDKEGKEARYVRSLAKTDPLTFDLFRDFVETRPSGVVANIAICLIHQTTYLLARQLKGLEKAFLEEGGIRERMTQARLNARGQKIGGSPPRTVNALFQSPGK